LFHLYYLTVEHLDKWQSLGRINAEFLGQEDQNIACVKFCLFVLLVTKNENKGFRMLGNSDLK